MFTRCFILWTVLARADVLVRGLNAVFTESSPRGVALNQQLPGLPCSLSESEYNALYVFYNATNGPNWIYNVFNQTAPWIFPSNLTSPCGDNWQGVVCSPLVNETAVKTAPDQFCVVTSISLGTQNLRGTIPSEIANLRFLEHFDVGTNGLYGGLPTHMSNMSSLRDLWLNNNRFSGPLPSIFGSMVGLSTLNLNSNNHISGSIPSSWCEMVNLTRLTAGDNLITGSIPSCIDQWPFLLALNLEGNPMGGSIPTELGTLTLLTELYLSSSNFTNTLPSQLGNLDNLVVMELQSNKLNGSLPDTICSLTKVTYLYLFSNHLTGTIPPCINNMSSLSFLKLFSNSLSQKIPSELLSHSRVQVLVLNNNLFTGTLPDKVSASIASLNINDNFLTKSIPSSFGDSPFLIYLSLNSNLLTGSIPDSLKSLQFAYFQANHLTGTLPAAMAGFSSLEYLSVYVNHLSGPLPSDFNATLHLVEIDLGVNYFTKTIPSSIGRLIRLQYLYLDHNSFTGTLPRDIGACPRLQLLWVEGNSLTGTMPSDIGNITSLEQFSFFDNSFEGTLPSELGKLSNLIRLAMSNNRVTGTLPPAFANMKSLATFNASTNRLRGSIVGLFPTENVFENLTTIDLSNNQFTGVLPNLLFRLPSLAVMSLYSNCFSGSIPSTICEASKAQTLALDSLSTGSTCVLQLPAVVNLVALGVFPIRHLQGGIPDCVWSLPSLQVLHLSGNGLHGTVGNLPENTTLKQISIAHNRLSGTIPPSMQRFGGFESFNLVNNKFSGSLMSQFAANLSSSISLSVNRLSGDIPQSVMNVKSVDILTGNLFACPNNELPKNDEMSGKYICGSNSLNSSVFTWITVFGFTMIILSLLAVVVKTCLHSRPPVDLGTRNEIEFNKETSCADALHQAYALTLRWLKFDIAEHPTLLSTGRFLRLMSNAGYIFLTLVVVYLLGPLVSYLVMKLDPNSAPVYSTHSTQYAWVTTAAYLHGSAPASLVLIYSFLSGLYIVYSFLGQGRVREIVLRFTSRATSEISWTEALRRHGIAVGLQLLNTVVSLTVNMGYVTAVILGRYSPSTLLLIQAVMSLYKVAWSSIYIPWAISAMSFLAERHLLRHEVFMNLVNFIMAPSIATFFTDSNCLYYAIAGQANITSTYDVTSSFEDCVGAVVDVTVQNQNQLETVTYCSQVLFTESVPISLTPPWFYSYQCGSELLVNYIPVLFYVYTLSGIVLPLMKYILVLMPSLATKYIPSSLCEMFLGGSIFVYNPPGTILSAYAADQEAAKNGSIRRLFRGGNVIAKRILDFAILATFGLAAPILGIAIGLQMFSNMILWRLLIGRYMFGNEHLDPSEEDAFCQRLESVTLPSTKGTVGSLWMVITTCSLFWCLLAYDMVADVYGAVAGEITAIVACVVPTACFPLFVVVVGYVRLKLSGQESILRQISKGVSTVQLTQLVSFRQSEKSKSPEESALPEALSNIAEHVAAGDVEGGTLSVDSTVEFSESAIFTHSLSGSFNDEFVRQNPLRE